MRASRILPMLSCWLPIGAFAIHTITGAAPIAGADGPNAEQTEFFETKIRPALAAHCYECHSGDVATPKGGLRLDLRETTLAGGDSGPAVIAGKPAESPLLQALRYESFEMPPKGKLPDSVIADFERWIQLGAPDPRTEVATKKPTGIDYQKGLEFWAFKPPVRVPLPGVVNSAWARNDIDHFVLSTLEKRGLKPAMEADRRTLIRRLYFDLVGLPPEPGAIDSFVNDTSSDACEKVIDGLLASPHYGERWGRYWLDLARFAEDQAHTFQARMYPQGYLYRDWVVRALNDDMPYDQFLRLQIAGDQMDVPESHRHRAALGLFALGPVYYQDNGEQEKAQADEWDDRIDTLMRGTQAMTVSCARCHDHKYDPISTADYYALAGIFASSEYREMPAVPEEIFAARELADRAVQAKQLEIDTLFATEAPAARQKLSPSIPAYMQAAWTAIQSKDSGKKKVTERIANDHQLNHELLQRWVIWLSEDAGSGANGNERRYLTEWYAFRKSHSEASSSAADASSQVHQIAERLRAQAESLLPQRESLRTQFWAASGEQLASSEAVEPLEALSEAELQRLKSDAMFMSELFDDRGVLGLAPDQIEPLLEGETAISLDQMKMRREELRTKAAAISVPMAHALAEGTFRDVKIYLAGDPGKKGNVAPRAFPAIFTSGEPLPFQPSGSGRRELADAIASPSNPLTARVMANRVWAGHFGFGLVRTLSNFGQLGERPSHPELLDSLAVSLIESGWSLKALHRQIVLSATYRQSSSGDDVNQTVDPENRLLWKMNRRRLEVEPWRDAVLSVSGQLNPEIGGASSELNGNHRRRTLYGNVSRHRLNDLLRLFDFPDPNITAGERSVTTVPLQQLFVLNSDFMIVQAKALAARLSREAESDADRINCLFQLLYGRMPTDEDYHVSLAFLQEPSPEASDSLSPLEQYCLAMLGTNEFAYVD